MTIALLGVNHKTASVALREQIAFDPEAIETALYSLTCHPSIDGAVILSTCNRTEIYLSFQSHAAPEDVKAVVACWLCEYHHIDAQRIENSFYWYCHSDAIEHLMSVACGMDSMILGEPQILGQVRQAYHAAHRYGCLSVTLNKLFETVFYVAKRVRTETQIGSHSASVAYSTCLMVRTLFPERQDLSLMLIGAGEMNTLIARYLGHSAFEKVLIANRTSANAERIAAPLNGEVIPLSAISERLKEVDIVISCTASPLPIIGKGMVERSIAFRKAQSPKAQMLFIDLAVPHDIEREIAHLPNVHLRTIDDLQQIVDQNLQQRQLAAASAKNIVKDEVQRFQLWLSERRAASAICAYRSAAWQSAHQLEMAAKRQLAAGVAPEEVVHQLTHRLTQQLLHAPTCTLKQSAQQMSELSFDLVKYGLRTQRERRSRSKIDSRSSALPLHAESSAKDSTKDVKH